MTTQTATRISLPALGILLVALLGVLSFGFFQTGTPYDENDPGYNHAYWTEQFSKKEVGAVYEEFKNRNAREPRERQHLSAHVMGELVYATNGIDGIAVCDASFGFGCYHGFFGRAISEGGEAEVAKLDAACVAAFGPLGTGCQHGIGHGVLEYVGYSRITDALKLCEQTTQSAPLLGCASGVFMEYNSPLAGEQLLPSTRAFTDLTVFEPCTSVSEKYQGSCYFQLGEWLTPSRIQEFETVGNICARLLGSAREHCFLGAGSGMAFGVVYEVEEGRLNCSLFSPDDELYCRAGLSWALYADPAHREKSISACAYDDASRTAQCLLYADLTEGKDGR